MCFDSLVVCSISMDSTSVLLFLVRDEFVRGSKLTKSSGTYFTGSGNAHIWVSSSRTHVDVNKCSTLGKVNYTLVRNHKLIYMLQWILTCHRKHIQTCHRRHKHLTINNNMSSKAYKINIYIYVDVSSILLLSQPRGPSTSFWLDQDLLTVLLFGILNSLKIQFV